MSFPDFYRVVSEIEPIGWAFGSGRPDTRAVRKSSPISSQPGCKLPVTSRWTSRPRPRNSGLRPDRTIRCRRQILRNFSRGQARPHQRRQRGRADQYDCNSRWEPLEGAPNSKPFHGRYRAPILPVVSIGATFGPYGVSWVVVHPAIDRSSASTDSVLRNGRMAHLNTAPLDIASRSLRPEIHPDAVIDELQRIGAAVVGAGVDHADFDHLVEKTLPARVGHRADAEFQRIAGIDDAI